MVRLLLHLSIPICYHMLSTLMYRAISLSVSRLNCCVFAFIFSVLLSLHWSLPLCLCSWGKVHCSSVVAGSWNVFHVKTELPTTCLHNCTGHCQNICNNVQDLQGTCHSNTFPLFAWYSPDLWDQSFTLFNQCLLQLVYLQVTENSTNARIDIAKSLAICKWYQYQNSHHANDCAM